MEIQKMFNATDFLRQEMANGTLLQASIFLAIIREEGITQPELARMFNSTSATVSRTCTKLAGYMERDVKTGKWRQGGLGLIIAREDTDDPRRAALFLAERGKELAHKLSIM